MTEDGRMREKKDQINIRAALFKLYFGFDSSHLNMLFNYNFKKKISGEYPFSSSFP